MEKRPKSKTWKLGPEARWALKVEDTGDHVAAQSLQDGKVEEQWEIHKDKVVYHNHLEGATEEAPSTPDLLEEARESFNSEEDASALFDKIKGYVENTVEEHKRKQEEEKRKKEEEKRRALMAKAVRVVFGGRETGAGAYTQVHIYSLRQHKEIKPHRTEYSRTGRHWRDIWFLLPGRYFVAEVDITNSGRNRSSIHALVVEDGGWRLEEWEGEPPEWAELPPEVLEALDMVEGEY